MSLTLDQGTKPVGLSVMTLGSDTILLGDYEISLKDFLCVAKYVLTNTDLEPDDPRLQFVKRVQSMEEVNGYNPGGKRLKSRETAVPSTQP